MKRYLICAIIASILSMIVLCGCGNRQTFDVNFTFNKAIMRLGDEIVTVDIAGWRDYEDGEQLQITSTDGVVYLTSSYNCTLIYEEEE